MCQKYMENFYSYVNDFKYNLKKYTVHITHILKGSIIYAHQLKMKF